MRAALLTLCLLGAGALHAQEPIPPSPPDGITPAITGPDKFRPHTIGVYSLPAAGQVVLDVVPGLDVVQRGNELFVTGPSGRYTLTGVWVDFEAKKIARLSKPIEIEGPPKPPAPPVPPGPVDPLVAELRVLWNLEPEATRAADLASLAELYRLMAGEAAKTTYATPADLNARWQTAVKNMLGDRLKGVRVRLAAEVGAAVGDPDANLTDAGRQKIATTYTRLAGLLAQVPQ